MNSMQALPAFHGYAIGNVITKSDLGLRITTHRIDCLAERQKQAAINYEALSTSDKKPKPGISQAQVDQAFHEKTAYDNALEEEAKKLKPADSILPTTLFTALEALPLEEESQKIKKIQSAFYSETMRYQLIREKITEAACRTILQSFLKGVFALSDTGYSLSTEKVALLSREIFQAIESETQLCVIAAIVSLPRVRVLDPVKVRKTATVADEYLMNPHKYLVLTESIMGGVFIGYGKIASSASMPESGPVIGSDFKYDIGLINYTSLGALPTVDIDAIHSLNFLKLYNSWKKKLEEDDNTGYPIGFRYRSLVDIFKEQDNALLPADWKPPAETCKKNDDKTPADAAKGVVD